MSDVLPEPGSVEPPKDAAASAAADAPPSAKPRATKERTPTTRATSLEKRLTELYVSLGTLVIVADPVCGTAVIQQAPETAAALDTLAKENPKVKRALEKMLAGGAWGSVVMAHFPIITTILAHHNMLPAQVAESLGIEPKAKPTLRSVDPDSNGETASVGERTSTS